MLAQFDVFSFELSTFFAKLPAFQKRIAMLSFLHRDAPHPITVARESREELPTTAAAEEDDGSQNEDSQSENALS